MDFEMKIKGMTLEYFDDSHTYVVDGVIVPSITGLLKKKFPGQYRNVSPDILNEAARRGTETHEAIERYCRYGFEVDMPELRNFKFLQKRYDFEVLENEVPVILLNEGEPIAAGRLDMVIKMDGKIGGADIKRTAGLNKEYVGYQLNLYRIAYRQCYEFEWEFLRAIHLKDDTRKFVNIPINEGMTWEFIKEYLEER